MKTRIISAAVAIAILIVILLLHSTFVFPLAIALISTLIVFELLRATKVMKHKELVITCGIFSMLYPFFANYPVIGQYVNILYILFALASFMILVLKHGTLRYTKFFSSIAFTVIVSVSLGTLVELNLYRPLAYVIIALCSAWIADTGAYFVGTFFGKHKLSPVISPKKSIEGFIGGIVFSAIICELIYIFAVRPENLVRNSIIFAFVALFSAAIGTLGDLSASVIKRQTKIKDYGNIMPGHGGALDRFDSVILVVPFFYICASVFGL